MKEVLSQRLDLIDKSEGVLRLTAIQEMKKSLAKEIQSGQSECKGLRESILRLVHQEGSLQSELKSILKRGWLYSEQELFDKVLDLYQFGKLTGALKNLEKDITAYLLLGTEVQQLQKAMQIVSSLEELSKQYKKGDREEAISTWATVSQNLATTLKAACSTDRYLDKSGLLMNQRFTKSISSQNFV